MDLFGIDLGLVSVRIEGEKIIQIFGGPDGKPMKNIRGENYMAYKNNRLRFNKLVMDDVDLILIDMDPNDPLDFWNIAKNSFRRGIQRPLQTLACACL